jgi:hypothetical protein
MRVCKAVGQLWASVRNGIGGGGIVSARPLRYRTNAPDRHGSIGFYGCADGRGKLIRCAFVGKGSPPQSAKVNCPACGLVHLAAPMWRPAVDGDGSRKAEVTIGDRERSAVAR